MLFPYLFCYLLLGAINLLCCRYYASNYLKDADFLDINSTKDNIETLIAITILISFWPIVTLMMVCQIVFDRLNNIDTDIKDSWIFNLNGKDTFEISLLILGCILWLILIDYFAYYVLFSMGYLVWNYRDKFLDKFGIKISFEKDEKELDK